MGWEPSINVSISNFRVEQHIYFPQSPELQIFDWQVTPIDNICLFI